MRWKLAFAVIASSLLVLPQASGQRYTGYCFDCGVDAEKGRLYVAAGAPGTHVYDLEDGVPKYALTLPPNRGAYHRNLKIEGPYCFVVDTEKLLQIYDIGGKKPKEVYLDRKKDGMGLHVEGGVIYIAQSKDGLNIKRFTPPKKVEHLGFCSVGGDAWDVWVKGNHAYVACVDTGLSVVDVSNPESPEFLKSLQWQKGKCTGEIIRGEGDTLCIAAGPDGLILYDISDPKRPKLASVFHPRVEDCAEGLAVQDGILYLANGNKNDFKRNGLMVMDVKNPRKPTLLATVPFGGWVEGVCLFRNFAYVANTQSGVRCVDVSDPKSPKLVSDMPPMTAEEKKVLDKYNTLLRKAVSGRVYKDQSTPAGAYVTLISASKQGDMKRYREVNPSYWKHLKETGGKLSLSYNPGTEICRVDHGVKNEEGSICAVHTGPGGQANNIEVFIFHKKKWRKLFNTGTHNTRWRDSVPKYFSEMKKILAE